MKPPRPRSRTTASDTGSWSIDNATLDIDADILITPMPVTGGITDPYDPRIARRAGVIERLDRAEITVKGSRRGDGSVNHHGP
jgi:hypothetical protein